jgi:putative membrane protein insertion efficiency factor
MKIRRAPRAIGLGAIAIYRAAVSPVIHAMNGPACRFEPGCSEYGREAIAEYGVVRGGAMAIWRIARCNPMGGHGYDPVPERIRRGPSSAALFSPVATRVASASSDMGRGNQEYGFGAERNLESRAKRALDKVPHLQSSPVGRGEEDPIPLCKSLLSGGGENSGFDAAQQTIAPQLSPTLTLPRQTWEGTGRKLRN